MAIYGTLGGQDSTTTGYPSIRPTLDLNFAQTKVLDPRVTFYRDSLATYTDSLGIVRTVPANVSRFDHNPTTGESLGLLIEEQRTNWYSYSETFAGIWTNDGIAAMTSNQAIAPDGNNTASKIVGPYIYRYFTGSGSPIANGSTVTASVFIKNNGANTLNFVIYSLGGTNVSASVNLSTGTVTGSGASIQSYPNGWYRVILTRTIDTGTGYVAIESLGGTGSSQSIYVWGAQLEQGSFSTSYIPTTTSTATRSADFAYMDGTNFSSWYNATEGTLQSEYIINGVDSAYNNTSVMITDGTESNYIAVFGYTPAYGWVQSSGATSFGTGVGGSTTSNTAYKLAVGYKVNDFASSLNGGTVATDNSGSIPTVNRMLIGRRVSLDRPLNGVVRRLLYYPKRLTNAQLQNLTAL
jgi:hypothetical protein